MIILLAIVASGLAPADQAAIYKAAGAVRAQGRWTMCADDPRRQPAAIEAKGDLNGDGRPEAIVTQDGSFCYGADETGFALVSKQADGRWIRLYDSPGVPEFLKTKGTAGWPDLSVGGQGFCFPVMRWNGKAYVQNRREYQGKRCR